MLTAGTDTESIMMSQRSEFKLAGAKETTGAWVIISHSTGRTNRHESLKMGLFEGKLVKGMIVNTVI